MKKKIHLNPSEIKALRQHRWYLQGDEHYLLLKSINILSKNSLLLTYYMEEKYLNKITSAKYPSKLTLAFTNGKGEIIKRIVFKGVKFKRHLWYNLDLDYSKTDLLKHTVELTFKTIKWSNLTKPETQIYPLMKRKSDVISGVGGFAGLFSLKSRLALNHSEELADGLRKALDIINVYVANGPADMNDSIKLSQAKEALVNYEREKLERGRLERRSHPPHLSSLLKKEQHGILRKPTTTRLKRRVAR